MRYSCAAVLMMFKRSQKFELVRGRLAVAVVERSLTERLYLICRTLYLFKVAVEVSRRWTYPVIQRVTDYQVLPFHIDADRAFCVAWKFDDLRIYPVG